MTEARTSRLPETRNRWATAAVFLMAVVLLATTLDFRMGVDQGVFAYIGAELANGHWPYLDTWEADYPGMMFLHALIVQVFGRSVLMFRVVDLVVQTTIAMLLFRSTRKLSDTAGGVLAAGMYCLIYQGYGAWNTAQREGFAMLFVLIGWWLYLTRERRSPFLTSALIGIGIGIAALFKPTMLALGWIYLPLLVRLRTSRDWRVASTGLLGCVTPAVLVVALYWGLGGLTQLIEATIYYPDIYTGVVRGGTGFAQALAQNLMRVGTQAKVVVLVMPFLLWWGPHRFERIMLYVGYVGTVVSVAVQGTFAGYHYLPGLALGAMLIGLSFSQVLDAGRALSTRFWPRRNLAVPLALALLIAALPAYVHPRETRDLLELHFLEPPRPDDLRHPEFDYYEDVQVANYLRQRTRLLDRIQVWGYESLVYYLAERSAASRFQMTHPLVMRVPGEQLRPMQLRWRQELITDVLRAKPVYVAVVRGDHWWWAPGQQTSEELLADFPEWKELIARDYQIETKIGKFAIYRRKSSTGALPQGAESLPLPQVPRDPNE